MAADDHGAPDRIAVNGLEQGAVSALERGLHYGDGLFETIACVGGRARFLSLHLARLRRGCTRLHILFRHADALRSEIEALAAPVCRAIVKVLVTRGPAVERGYRVTGAEEATRVTLRYRWPQEDPAEAGVRVRLAALRLAENPLLAGLKHLNRLEQVLARHEWSDPGIAEALMLDVSGNLVSGVMSNVFLVQNGRLRTPRVDRCGVAGVMREVVMREAPAAGIVLEETQLRPDDLMQASEVFLTSALIGIRPVRALEGRVWAPGPVTRAVQERVAALLAAGGDD
ncbi:MAG: aminodeoxychorismate lyase [Steroidobacteraceae bacterium]